MGHVVVLPLLVQIETGKVNSEYGNEWERFAEDSFRTEEWAEKVDDRENEFKTKIKVFVCPEEHSYFRNLIIFDKKVS